MKKIGLSTVALLVMTSLAAAAHTAHPAPAEPLRLTEVQMDHVMAGQQQQEGLINVGVNETQVNVVIANVAANILGEQRGRQGVQFEPTN